MFPILLFARHFNYLSGTLLEIKLQGDLPIQAVWKNQGLRELKIHLYNNWVLTQNYPNL